MIFFVVVISKSTTTTNFQLPKQKQKPKCPFVLTSTPTLAKIAIMSVMLKVITP